MGRRVSFFHRLVALPLPPLLDSGLRRNYEWGAGLTKGRRVDVGGGIAVGVLSRDVSAWIPAFAGMTNWGAGATSAGAAAFRHTRGRATSFSFQ